MRDLRDENVNCFRKLGLLKVIHVTHMMVSVSHIVLSSFSTRFTGLCLF